MEKKTPSDNRRNDYLNQSFYSALRWNFPFLLEDRTRYFLGCSSEKTPSYNRINRNNRTSRAEYPFQGTTETLSNEQSIRYLHSLLTDIAIIP